MYMRVVLSIGEALGDCWLSDIKGKNVDWVDDADDGKESNLPWKWTSKNIVSLERCVSAVKKIVTENV